MRGGIPLKKYPQETRTMVLDFYAKLAPDETILAPPTVSVDDPSLTLGVAAVLEATVQLKVSGGILGRNYTVLAQVGTTNGNVIEESRVVEVSNDAN